MCHPRRERYPDRINPTANRADDGAKQRRSQNVETHQAWVQTRVKIQNRLGLHARPAMSFVDTANTFGCEIRVEKGDQDVDGKSIMQMMMLAATMDTELTIRAKGHDADDALTALNDLVNRKFDEE